MVNSAINCAFYLIHNYYILCSLFYLKKKTVVDQVEKEGKRAWREEVEGRQDLGDYKDRQLVLERADYTANGSGDKIRAEIKEKCAWGDHFIN